MDPQPLPQNHQTDLPATELSQVSRTTDVIVPGRSNVFTKFTVKGSLFPVLFILMATIGIVSYANMNGSQDIRSKAALDGPVLSMNPNSKALNTGESASIGVLLSTNSDSVSVSELHISYDPAAIQILSFTPNPTLPVVLKPAAIGIGTIDIALGSQPGSPFKGSGILGVLTVKQISPKSSSIAFMDSTIVAAIGKQTNALSAKSGATLSANAPSIIQFTGTPTVSPIMTTSLIPTSTPTTVSTPTPTPNPYNGKPVKGATATTYLIENGVRRPIPDWDTFLSLGFKQSDQITLTDEQINSIPLGAEIPSAKTTQ